MYKMEPTTKVPTVLFISVYSKRSTE